MTREIKYRCWDKENKRWSDQVSTYQELADQAMWNPERSEYYQLVQYTGLKDKNGKEIYEGDIIKLIDTMGMVFYNSATASFDHEYEGGDNDSLYSNIEADIPMEVIGNIYETPELLK